MQTHHNWGGEGKKVRASFRAGKEELQMPVGIFMHLFILFGPRDPRETPI